MPTWPSAVRTALDRLARRPLVTTPSPVEELPRLRAALGGGPRLLIKRDDALSFGFGGNKVRKLEYMAGAALAAGADTLITCGGLQSNHARATAAVAAHLGLRAVLVLNGAPPATDTGNLLLDRLLGADVHFVATREARVPTMRELAARLAADGARPFEIPVGASTPLGAAGYARAFEELAAQMPLPDRIVHSTSSGGTQAGLVLASTVAGSATRIDGISADEPAEALGGEVQQLVAGMYELLDAGPEIAALAGRVHVDDRFIGEGYGVSTRESIEAAELLARTEAIFLDPTYTAKAMAGLIHAVRTREIHPDETVLFWHTGGLPGLFR